MTDSGTLNREAGEGHIGLGNMGFNGDREQGHQAGRNRQHNTMRLHRISVTDIGKWTQTWTKIHRIQWKNRKQLIMSGIPHEINEGAWPTRGSDEQGMTKPPQKSTHSGHTSREMTDETGNRQVLGKQEQNINGILETGWTHRMGTGTTS